MSNRYIQPAIEIMARLAFHAVDGEILSGLTYMAYEPITNISSKDLPYMHPYQFTMAEEGFAGAARTPEGVCRKRADQSLFFWVAAPVENGWVGEETGTREMGVLRWLPNILDAMETDREGNPDPLLCGTLDQPMQFSVNLTEQTQLSWDILLQVKLFSKAFTLGERALA